MKKLIVVLSACVLASCASVEPEIEKPNLYGYVLPMADGQYMTEPVANDADKAVLRATRNAERYCAYKQIESYSVASLEKTVEAGEKPKYRAKLVFKCE